MGWHLPGVTPEREDHYSIMPGTLRKLSDEEKQKIYAKTGVYPLSPECQKYVTEEGMRRAALGEDVDTDMLRDEYERLHKEGKI